LREAACPPLYRRADKEQKERLGFFGVFRGVKDALILLEEGEVKSVIVIRCPRGGEGERRTR